MKAIIILLLTIALISGAILTLLSSFIDLVVDVFEK